MMLLKKTRPEKRSVIRQLTRPGNEGYTYVLVLYRLVASWGRSAYASRR